MIHAVRQSSILRNFRYWRADYRLIFLFLRNSKIDIATSATDRNRTNSRASGIGGAGDVLWLEDGLAMVKVLMSMLVTFSNVSLA